MKRPCKGQIALAKVKGIYCNKVCCFAGLVKSVGIINDDNFLWSHRTSTQQKQTKKSTDGKVFNDKTLFATLPRQSTIHATVPMTKFSKNAATFGKSKMQLPKADNQLSRQEASPFTNINAQLCTQGL